MSVQAGNKLPLKQITITDSAGTAAGNGQRADYILTNPTIMFDKDFPKSLAIFTVGNINQKLVDIQLQTSFSEVDYNHATDILPFRYEPNRIFVHYGSGWSSDFAASLRTFSDNTGACFIALRKELFEQAELSIQAKILTHEIFHCLRWAHAEDNPYVDNFDFENQDNVEVLYRLYDMNNKKQMVTVDIDQDPIEITGFVARKKDRINSVYTTDDEVKLIPGRYKIQINDKFICKKKKKLCGSIKKAKKFKLKLPSQ